MTLRAVVFGDPGTGTWGAALSLHAGLPSFAVVVSEQSMALDAAIQPGGSVADEWRIAGDGLELSVAPETSAIEDSGSDFDQLVTVRGRVSGDHAPEISCRGCRSERTDAVEPDRFQLIRDVGAWFGPGEGLAVIAVRPRRASGHGNEHVTATVFSTGHSLPVAEPRLSTTYTERGHLSRTTLELWLADDDTGNRDEDEGAQYPRRAAGQAFGPGTTHEVDRFAVQLQPFRWRAERRDGAGVYLLVRPR